MPTLKPRISITLEPHTHEVLQRLSGATGQSMASFVASLVEVASPSLVRLAVVMERAAAAPAEVRAGLLAAVERAERDALPSMVKALDQGDMFLADLEASTAGVSADAQRPKSRRRAKQTPVL